MLFPSEVGLPLQLCLRPFFSAVTPASSVNRSDVQSGAQRKLSFSRICL